MTQITKRYFPTTIRNPTFDSIIEELQRAGLYSDMLISGPAVTLPVEEGGIAKYKNGNDIPNSAIALDVISDSISKGVLKWLRDGSELGDPSKNIHITPTTSLASVQNMDNVKDVILTMANEISNLKKALDILIPAMNTVPELTVAVQAAQQILNSSTASISSDKKILL